MSKKILCVEDEFLIRINIVNMLSERYNRHDIYEAQNGDEGFKKYQEIKPDIIITDIKMSPVDGIEMSRAIRKVDKDIPIIVVSAFEKEFFNLSELDIQDYLIKPISSFELLSKVEKYLV